LPLWLAGLLGAALTVHLAASAFLVYPPVDRDAPQHLPLGEYVGRATASLLTGFSFRDPDPYLSVGYFGGFGWMDAPLSETLVRVLAGAVGLGLVLLIGGILKARSSRRACRLLLWGASVSGVGALTAVAAHGYAIGLAGRYLIGFYCIALAICFTGYTIWFQRCGCGASSGGLHSRLRVATRRGAAALCVLLAAALHTATLLHLLTRYFG
jgi:hypothetical protein